MSNLIPWLDFGRSFKEFCFLKRNRPGTLIEFKIKERTVQFLIGDVNVFGGTGDKKNSIPENTIITRYKIIFHH